MTCALAFQLPTQANHDASGKVALSVHQRIEMSNALYRKVYPSGRAAKLGLSRTSGDVSHE
jgi:hypothetical protein